MPTPPSLLSNTLRTDLVTERAGLSGLGLFAKVPIPQGTVLGCLTPGIPMRLPIDAQGRAIYGPWESAHTIDLLVDKDQLICLVKDFGPQGPCGVDLMNHSCTPNCEVVARLVARTLRDIAAGEELTIDYLAAEITIIKEGVPCLCRVGCETVI